MKRLRRAWWADQAKIRRAGLETLGDPRAARDDLPTVVILRADKGNLVWSSTPDPG